MIKSIIVEDDPLHSDRLLKLLNQVDRSVKVLAIESNITSALNSITEIKPDLVFIDIVLDNGQSGFELLKKIEKIDFNIIFISAHLSYENTLNAIRLCALDFLPKPFIRSELEVALLRHKSSSKIEMEKLNSLKHNISNNNLDLQEIWIANVNEFIKIEIANILYAKSDNVTTTFYLIEKVENKHIIVSSTSIGEWVKLLTQSSIFRTHNQYLVNLKHVLKYIKGEGGELIMRNMNEIPVSRNKKAELLERLQIFKKQNSS